MEQPRRSAALADQRVVHHEPLPLAALGAAAAQARHLGLVEDGGGDGVEEAELVPRLLLSRLPLPRGHVLVMSRLRRGNIHCLE